MESKYYHQLWRPITAIRAGDTDGNPNTEPDPTWTPLANTPNHPEYPSAHAFGTGAAAEALRQFFGTKKLRMTLSSSITGTSMDFGSTDELTKAVDDARIFAGLHYRTACVRGGVLGTMVAKYVARHYFQQTQQTLMPLNRVPYRPLQAFRGCSRYRATFVAMRSCG